MSLKTVYGTIDAWTNQDHPNVNHGPDSRLMLKGQTSHKKYGYVLFAKPFPPGALVLNATMTVTLAASWPGTTTITVRRVTASWRESGITWNNQPATSGTHVATKVVTGGAKDDAVTVDLTAMIADVASGAAWYGVRVEVDVDGPLYLWASEAVARPAPKLDIEWTLTPDAVTDMHPLDGAVVGTVNPVLTWTFRDTDGTADQASSQVQVDTTDAFASPVYDSGLVANGEQQWTIAPNLLPLANQADFEVDATTGLVIIGGGSKVQDGTQFSHGAKSLKVTTPGSVASEGFGIGSSAGSTTNDAPVVAGDTYTFQIALRGNAGGEQVALAIFWRTAAGAAISSSVGPAVTLTTAWQVFTFTATAPATAAFVELAVRTSGTHAYVWFNDAAQFERGADAHPWALPGSALADGGDYFWRVRAIDTNGNTSDWSDIGSFHVTVKGALTITSPSTTPEETTPPVSWTLASGTQVAYQVILRDLIASPPSDPGGSIVFDTGRVASTGTTVAIPPGKMVRTDTNGYQVEVRVWDNTDRESTPGSPGYSVATRTMTLTPSGVPTDVLTLAATDDAPAIALQWTRTNMPDNFALRVDGDVPAGHDLNGNTWDHLDPADYLVSGTTYRLLWYRADPTVSHVYEVIAVVDNGAGVLQMSTGNPTATFASRPVGLWLVDEASGERVRFEGRDDPSGSWKVGEEATDYYPVGRRSPVHIVTSLRGYEGSMSGLYLNDWEDVTADEYRAALEAIKASGSTKIRMIVQGFNIPVILSDVSVAPSHPAGYSASFTFAQSDEFGAALGGRG